MFNYKLILISFLFAVFTKDANTEYYNYKTPVLYRYENYFDKTREKLRQFKTYKDIITKYNNNYLRQIKLKRLKK